MDKRVTHLISFYIDHAKTQKRFGGCTVAEVHKQAREKILHKKEN